MHFRRRWAIGAAAFGVFAATTTFAPAMASGPSQPMPAQIGIVQTIVGSPAADPAAQAAGFAGDGGQATSSAALFGHIRDAVYGPDGSLYFTDSEQHRVRKVDPQGVLSTIAGTGTAGRSGENVSSAGSLLIYPHGLALTPDESKLLIAESGSGRIRAITFATGLISTYVGKPGDHPGDGAYGGDGGPAIGAGLLWPSGMSFAVDGSLLIADSTDNRVRKVSNPGTNSAVITTIAGTGTVGAAAGLPPVGDGGPATAATLNAPRAAIELPDHSILISEEEGNRIRRVSPGGTISTFAGGSTFPATDLATGYGDGGPANEALFNHPRELRLAPDKGSVFVGDRDNGSIRRILLSGNFPISTFAGITGSRGWDGSNLPAAATHLRLVFGMSISNGWLIYTTGNKAVQRVGLVPATPPTVGPTAAPKLRIQSVKLKKRRCLAKVHLAGTAGTATGRVSVQLRVGRKWKTIKTAAIQNGRWASSTNVRRTAKLRVVVATSHSNVVAVSYHRKRSC